MPDNFPRLRCGYMTINHFRMASEGRIVRRGAYLTYISKLCLFPQRSIIHNTGTHNESRQKRYMAKSQRFSRGGLEVHRRKAQLREFSCARVSKKENLKILQTGRKAGHAAAPSDSSWVIYLRLWLSVSDTRWRYWLASSFGGRLELIATHGAVLRETKSPVGVETKLGQWVCSTQTLGCAQKTFEFTSSLKLRTGSSLWISFRSDIV